MKSCDDSGRGSFSVSTRINPEKEEDGFRETTTFAVYLLIHRLAAYHHLSVLVHRQARKDAGDKTVTIQGL